jgi:hypothetical protein
MAALMCQGDRAKVNFLDSWDIVQQYDTTAIREPFRDHHRETREHTAGMQSARQHSFGQGVDFTPLTYESADTSKPTALGRLLNSFADRFPYAAVRDLDPAVWDVFTERNSTLSAFSEFGSQLLWLSSQVTDAAMKDSWGLHQGAFERDCRNTDQGGKCVEALKLYDHQGVDWDKVVWPAQARAQNLAFVASFAFGLRDCVCIIRVAYVLASVLVLVFPAPTHAY